MTSSGTWAPDEPPREPAEVPTGPVAPTGWPPNGPVGPPVRPPEHESDGQARASDPPAGPSSPGEPVRTAPASASYGSSGGTPDPMSSPMRTGPPVAPPASRPAAAPPRPMTVGATPARKGGRRARLTVKRIDPWSTLKFSFVYSLAGLVVLLVAVVALYAIVDSMGVIASIQSFLRDVDQPKSGQGIAEWLTFGRVFTVAMVLGIVNVILFTAFATLTAFVYNVCTDLVGGIEVTLAERS